MKRQYLIDWRYVCQRAIAVIHPDQWYRVDEAAGLLGLSRRTLLHHHTMGNLVSRTFRDPGTRSHLEFSGSALIEFCREQVRYARAPKAA